MEAKSVVETTGTDLEAVSTLRRAIKSNNIEGIKDALQDETVINIPLQIGGILGGYTALHIACMQGDEDLVKMLVNEYHADVNVAAEDGTQPIHLACFYGNEDEMVKILLPAGANIDAEVDKYIFSRHMEDEIWRDNFGEKMTIATMAILYDRPFLALFLMEKQANSNIKDRKNKTLLMYAVEEDHWLVVQQIVRNNCNNSEYLNSRDDDGYSAIHYMFHPNKYGDYRYDGNQLDWEELRDEAMFDDYKCYCDIYATVNGDPNTLLINMAAYRASPNILSKSLPFYENIKDSKALYLATLPLKDPIKYLRINPNIRADVQWRHLFQYRQTSFEIIVKDLINRLTFRSPVPKEEKRILDTFIANFKDIRKIVQKYQQDFIWGYLKKSVFRYGGKTLTCFDFISQCYDNKTLQILVRDKEFIKSYESHTWEINSLYFKRVTNIKIRRARKRIELLDSLKTVKHLQEAIPLPFEWILDIVEFLTNEELDQFINSFIIS